MNGKDIAAEGYRFVTVPASLERLESVYALVHEELESAGCELMEATPFDIAIDELYSNVVKFSGSETITVGVAVSPSRISVRLMDSGRPYDPRTAPEPDITLALEDRDLGGLGVFMVGQLMDEFEYEFRDGQNITTIRKQR